MCQEKEDPLCLLCTLRFSSETYGTLHLAAGSRYVVRSVLCCSKRNANSTLTDQATGSFSGFSDWWEAQKKLSGVPWLWTWVFKGRRLKLWGFGRLDIESIKAKFKGVFVSEPYHKMMLCREHVQHRFHRRTGSVFRSSKTKPYSENSISKATKTQTPTPQSPNPARGLSVAVPSLVAPCPLRLGIAVCPRSRGRGTPFVAVLGQTRPVLTFFRLLFAAQPSG